MGLGNLLLLSQVTLYLLSFIISFFIFIPLTVNHNEFQGHCLLHATGTWDTPEQLQVTWGNPGDCSFGIFVGVVLFPVSLFYVLWMAVFLFKGTEPSWASAFVALLVSVVTCVMIFVSGVVVTSGYRAWCAVLQPNVECSNADFIPFLKDTSINSRNFNVEFGMAQFGLWTTWIIWLLLVLMSSIQLYQYHNQEDFFVSLHRERERLIQRVNPNAQASYSV